MTGLPNMSAYWANASLAMRANSARISADLERVFGQTVVRIRPEPIGTAHSFTPKYIVGRANTCPCCGHRAFWVGAKVADCGACGNPLDIVRPLHPAAHPSAQAAPVLSTQTMARIALLSLRARARQSIRERMPK